jgi:hypothetical protein
MLTVSHVAVARISVPLARVRRKIDVLPDDEK